MKLSATTPLLLLLLLLLLLFSAPASAQNEKEPARGPQGASLGGPGWPAQKKEKECCAALATVPGFEAAASSPVPVPVLILTLPQPLPETRGVELEGRLCECGVGAAAANDGEEESDNADDEEQEEEKVVEIRIRGSTSAREFAKKSFAMNVKRESRGSPLLGTLPPTDGRFALLGVVDDRTLGARSTLTFDAFREAFGRWAPRSRHAELFVRVVPPPAAAAPAAPAVASASVSASAELAPATPAAAAVAAGPLALPSANAAAPALEYRGVYLVTERVTRHRQRVDVKEYEASAAAGDGDGDPTGGFLVAYENDNIRPGEAIFATRMSRLTFVVEDPSERRPANASALAAAAAGRVGGGGDGGGGPARDPLVYLTDFFNGLERALLTPGPLVTAVEPSPSGLRQKKQQQQPQATVAALPPLAAVLDAAAAVDYFLITELAKSSDGYRGSVKMHKDAQGPLVIGTPWDYGEAYGACCGFPIEGYRAGGRSGPGTSGGSAISPNGWRFNICQDPGRCLVEPADGTSQWFRRLWQDGAFRAGAAARWRGLREGALNDSFFVAAIGRGEQALASSGAAARNNALWSAELPPKAEDMLALERAGGAGALAAAAAAASAVETMTTTTTTATPPPPPPPAQFLAANLALRNWVLARLAWMDRALAAVSDPAAPPDAYLTAA
jgi:hypothetical protein